MADGEKLGAAIELHNTSRAAHPRNFLGCYKWSGLVPMLDIKGRRGEMGWSYALARARYEKLYHLNRTNIQCGDGGMCLEIAFHPI
jgi:hypothetical protein